jgi:serine/threonine-protein kinase
MPPIPATIGQFEVVGLLGKGAMGEVYEGVDSVLNRRVALKVLGRKHQENPEFKTRFLREGRSLASMNHANVVQIYFIGEFDGRPFLAMEYLDGEDIGAALKKRGALEPGDAAEVIRQAAIGLAETQRAGVVHRDVKPSNLVITMAGAVKVTDFGLAKALQEDLSITATGVFVGTPDYLAPEQAMGEEVDAAADIYALGCSLFHMCSGHPPFRKGGADDHYTAVVRRHLKAERPQLKQELVGFDEELSDLCRRMMSRRPDVRPDFDTLTEELGRISQRLGGQVPPRHIPVKLKSDLETRPHPEASEAGEFVEESSGLGRNAVIVAVGLGVAVGVAVTLAALALL